MGEVLVVEDDVVVCRVLEHVLELEDHKAIVVHDVSAAKDVLATRDVDIVLLDLMLPGGYGLELVNYLRREVQLSTPVIVLSAIKHEQNVVEALDAGANDFITKPFSPTELLSRIRKWVEGRENLARTR